MRYARFGMAKKIRIILDTNWYISAAINKKSRRLFYELLTNPHLKILFCDEILIEFKIVIARSKFLKFVSPGQVTRFINLVAPKFENIEIATKIKRSRDVDDDFLLSLSVDGNADYLITGDLDLLVLKNQEDTQITRMSEFLTIISHTIQ